ncbi:adenosine deaminase, partial [Klebsiella pneumoniae]|nr:adenosine deaminase [Klebsiella pneumoniae]
AGDTHYARTLRLDDGAPASLRVTAITGEAALQLELRGVPATALMPVVQRVRRMFDLDADPAAVRAVFEPDPLLGPCVRAWPGLRVPGGFD